MPAKKIDDIKEPEKVTPAQPVTPPPATPAAQPAAPAPAVPQAKKSHTALIVILIVVLLLFVLPTSAVVGLGYFAKKKIEKVTEEGVNLGNGQISVNTSEDQKWPTTMPVVVPKFTAGKIDSSGRIGDNWTVVASEVTLADYNAYKATLASSGYTISGETDLGEGFKSLTAKKGDYTLNLTFTTGDEGKSSLLISVAKDLPETTNQLPESSE